MLFWKKWREWKRINQASGKENEESEPHSAALMSALRDNKDTFSIGKKKKKRKEVILDLHG